MLSPRSAQNLRVAEKPSALLTPTECDAEYEEADEFEEEEEKEEVDAMTFPVLPERTFAPIGPLRRSSSIFVLPSIHRLIEEGSVCRLT